MKATSIASAATRIILFENKYPKNNRPRQAIEAAERFADNPTDATRSEMTAAGDAENKWQANTLRTMFNPFKKGIKI